MTDRPEPEILRELHTLYADLERELAALRLSCRGCGECCRFDRAEHVLYASAPEIELLLAIAPPEKCPPGRCPYQTGDACLARAGRTLGCRLHFCAAAGETAAALEEISCRYHARLKDLHDACGIEWNYRPLLECLAIRREPGVI